MVFVTMKSWGNWELVSTQCARQSGPKILIIDQAILDYTFLSKI